MPTSRAISRDNSIARRVNSTLHSIPPCESPGEFVPTSVPVTEPLYALCPPLCLCYAGLLTGPVGHSQPTCRRVRPTWVWRGPTQSSATILVGGEHDTVNTRLDSSRSPVFPHSGSHPLFFFVVIAQSEGRSHRPSPGCRTLLAMGIAGRRASVPPSDCCLLFAPTFSQRRRARPVAEDPSTPHRYPSPTAPPVWSAAVPHCCPTTGHLLLLLRSHHAGDRT